MCILLDRGVNDQKIAEFVGVHQDTVKAWRFRAGQEAHHV